MSRQLTFDMHGSHGKEDSIFEWVQVKNLLKGYKQKELKKRELRILQGVLVNDPGQIEYQEKKKEAHEETNQVEEKVAINFLDSQL